MKKIQRTTSLLFSPRAVSQSTTQERQETAQPGSGSASGSIQVTFDRDPVITGFCKAITLIPASRRVQEPDVKRTVVASVDPSKYTGDITFDIIGTKRAKYKVVRRTPKLGTIVIEVRGLEASLAKAGSPNEPKIDTWLVAYYRGNEVGRAGIIVVIPAHIGRPHPEIAWTNVGYMNRAQGRKSTPPRLQPSNRHGNAQIVMGH